MSWFKKLLSPSAKKEQPVTEQPQVAGADVNNNGEDGEDVPPGEAPATCQIEAKSKFPFQKKKMIVASVGADGKPVYTQGQIEAAMKKLSDRKKARKKAREEERQYVEFRKQEILAQFRPTVGALRSGDEAFPKRRRGMGFGERKAFYLSIRPNPKYAVWVGKKKEKVRQAKIVAPLAQATDHGITDHSALPPAEQSKREEKTEREPDSQAKTEKTERNDVKPSGPKTEEAQTKTEEPKSVLEKNAEVDKDKTAPKAPKPKKKEKQKKKKEKQKKNEKSVPKGNNAANPIINGVPFWTIANAADQDEMTDDDLPIDMEILEKVWNGDITLPQKPHMKKQWNPYGPINRFRIDDKLFVRDTILFSNTVESVLALQPDNEAKPKPAPATPKVITWNNKISVTTFEPANRLPKEKREPVVEPLKDLKRERKGK